MSSYWFCIALIFFLLGTPLKVRAVQNMSHMAENSVTALQSALNPNNATMKTSVFWLCKPRMAKQRWVSRQQNFEIALSTHSHCIC